MMTGNLKSKRVLLIGANGGVGAAIMRELLDADAAVIATVSRPEKISKFRADFPGAEDYIALDLSDSEAVLNHLAKRLADVDRLDAVIHCPAICVFGAAEVIPLAAVRESMEVNLLSALAVYQATIDHLRRAKGRIVFIGSLSGKIATPVMGAYVSSKFALEGLVDSMRQEASQFGVSVILLQPGSIATPMVDRCIDELTTTIKQADAGTAELYKGMYENAHKQLIDQQKNETASSAAEVAAAAIKSLGDPQPETRYRIGADAHFLLEACRTKSDREMDSIILGESAA